MPTDTKPGTPPTTYPTSAPTLRPNVLSLLGVLMQSVTTIAPASAGLFTVPFIVLNAGAAAPLAYLGSFVIALFLGYVLAQFSRHLSSAGSYYTFVSRSLGGRAGFLVAWIYLLFYPVVLAQAGSYMGDVLQDTLKSAYDITFPWWAFVLLLILVCLVTTYRGIELSVRLLIVLGIVETLIVLALAVTGFALPGDGGVSFDVFLPSSAPSFHGLALGVIFAIFAITGWDAAAPLAEESANPKRTIPQAVMGSILILGVFVVVVSWGQISGFDSIAGFNAATELQGFVLAKQHWGAGWWLVLFALVNSTIAVTIACTNAATRFLFGMARAGALPRYLTRTHPRFKTPVSALWTQTGVNIVLGLVLPLIIGVENVYSLTGTWFTFALALVYIAANIGLPIYYRREHPAEFSVWKHVVIPTMGSVALILIVYYSVNPLPPFPVSLAPFIVLGWLCVGIAVQAVAYAGPRAALLKWAGAAMGETTVTPAAGRHQR